MGITLHVTDDGPPEGAPVLFLHGVFGSEATYRWLPNDLTAGRRCLRLDFRGHGRSERAPGSYVIDRYGEDVVSVLRALDRPAVLVGHSLGGVAAWWVAQRHPELVAAAFLEDPPLYMGEPDEHALNGAVPLFRILRESAARWQADGLDPGAVAVRIAAAPFGPDPARKQGDALTAEALAARAEALLHVDPAVLDPIMDGTALARTDTASDVTVPVLVLAAGDAMGTAFPTRHEQRLAQTHPAVEVVRLSTAGHSIHDEREHRGAYSEQVARFLAAHA